jgi:hypothetical protein
MDIINTPAIYTKDQQTSLLGQKEIDINSIEFKEETSIDILGFKVDLQYFIILTIIFVITNLFLYLFGIFKKIQKNPLLFFVYLTMIGFFVYKIFAATVFTANIQLEISNLLVTNQSISVFIGSLILLIIFMNYISSTSSMKFSINHYIYVLCILLFISLNLSVQQIKGNQLRANRRFKETMLDAIKFLLVFLLINDLSNKE